MPRLGDDIDDFCIKCKRLTNHSIVSLLDEKPAKVRCRTCYHDHDFRNEEPLPSKKELKAAASLLEAVMGAKKGASADLDAIDDIEEEEEEEDDLDPAAAADIEEDEVPVAVAKPKKTAAVKKAAKKAASKRAGK